MTARSLQVLIWNENQHEQIQPEVREIYPEGIHGTLRTMLSAEDLEISTATLDDENQGITDDRLSRTDVLVWWGHMAHDKVEDRVVECVSRHVNGGMGFVALHSAHHSRVFGRLMGTNCNLAWREADDGERVRVWTIDPSHPIAQGVPGHVEIAADEMYGEPFNVPKPDDVIFVNWVQGGEVFRSGCTWRRGRGRVFYFSPGHETFPIYHNPEIAKIIGNGIRWAAAPHAHGHDLSNLHRPVPLEPSAPRQS